MDRSAVFGEERVAREHVPDGLGCRRDATSPTAALPTGQTRTTADNLAEGDPPTMDTTMPTDPPAPSPPSVRDQMEHVFQLLVDRAPEDAALREFANKHSVSSNYIAGDLGVEFYVDFRDGRVITGLGAPPQPAQVKLTAKAETLDAVLTGRLGGKRAAMTGKLSFTGDMRLAMSMQKILGDMIRLYSAARKEAGGIDFSATGARSTTRPPAPDRRPDSR
jgi:putative sterol carrier protein